MIYFAQPVDGGPIKIGHSENVPRRLVHLKSHYGKPVVLLATLPGNRDTERAVHAKFAHLRDGRTEHFRPDPELTAFIDLGPTLDGLAVVPRIPAAGPAIDFASRFHSELGRLGMPYDEAAERLGVTRTAVRQFTNPRLSTICRLVSELGMDPWVLMPEFMRA